MYRLLFLLVACLQSLPLYAQSGSRFFPAADDTYVDERTFFGAVSAGTNFCQVDGDALGGYHRIGINAGATVYLRHPRWPLAFSMELRYAQKGCVAAYEAGGPTGAGVERYGIKLAYAEVPVMLHLLLPGRVTYSAGLAYGRLASSGEYAELLYPVNFNQDLYPFRKQEWSWLLGGCYTFRNHWSVEARYQYSLTSVRDAAFIPVLFNSGRGGQYNNVVSVRLQYIF